ncbi:MAG TPA: AMP-binding protein, partial [Capillimicrobium sp.]
PALADRAPARLLRAPGALLAAGAAAGRRRRSARPGDELLVGLTSGTSGEPKLFARDHASWAATLERSDATFDVRPGDLVSTPGPLDHTHFLYGALHALTRGATVDLRPLGDAFAAGRAVTHAYLVPTLAADLAQRLGGGGARGLREALSSAAPWPGPARDRLRAVAPSATVSHFLGASELSFVALDSSREPGPAGSAGRPFAGVELEIRDRQGRPLPDGEVGEVFVRSDMLFSGYLTPRGLRGGPSADGWATVGDLGSVRDGWLTLAGRASDTIVSGGFNVEPAAVERALADLPGVREVACIGLADGRWGAVPAAVLSLEDAAPPPSRAAVRALARERLPQPSRPRRVFVVDALPRSPRGKLRRADLARLVADGGARELGPG